MRFFTIAFLLLSINGFSMGKDSDLDPGLVKLIEQIDAKSSTIHALKADFVQLKEISLLTEPVEMKGVFYLKKQQGIKFDFEPKEDLELIVNKEEMVSLSPKAKRATRVKMKKRRTELTQGILTEKIIALVGYFNITRVGAEGQGQHLKLEPTKRKLKKKFKDVDIWVNKDHMIYKVRVTSPDGDVFQLSLANMEINPEIDNSLFETKVPDGFELGDRMEFIFGANIAF